MEITYIVEEDEINARKQKTEKATQILGVLLFPLAVFFLELSNRFFCFGFSINAGIIYILLFSLSAGLLLSSLTMLFKKRNPVLFILLLILILYYGFNIVYYSIFHSFFSWSTLFMAAEVTDFYREAVAGIIAAWLKIAIILIPLILFLVFKKKIKLYQRFSKNHLLTFIVSIGMTVLTVLLIVFVNANKTQILTLQTDYSEVVKSFGLGIANIEEGRELIFGAPETEVENPYEVTITSSNKSDVTLNIEKLVLYNTLNIDFDKLIAKAPNSTIRKMHEYFASNPASEKNEYTGYFAGKNLIFLTLEGFSSKVIIPELMPTLYMMSTEGFVFTNSYSGQWGGSTASGEYANMTGNFYSSASCLRKSANTNTYSAMGNMFKRSGYNTYAFHNWYASYYDRDKSHPNFGYKYKAYKSGISLTYHWPTSDYEMATKTINDYINSDKPFHAYYLTLSGHTNYTWKGNNMASRHRKKVQKTGFTNENVKAIIACNIEVENMLTYLIKKLEEAGKLQDTVFAMNCDHYPYGLPNAALAQLYGLDAKDIRSNIELYKNQFILWSACMDEPVIVDTPMAAYDIVPTLANLFGLEYESKVITGTDVFSDKENIAIINTLTGSGGNWNWKTTQGTYYSVTKRFVKSENCTLKDDEIKSYVASINSRVSAMRKYSIDILDYNYYNYLFDKNGKPRYTKE
ncbi:MAG: LTA synthase family protein [Erysipelotrichaceae bacterium]|jgi:lipoteichoic acid synthase